MKKCTKCFVIQPIENFRLRIRKNPNGTTNDDILSHCKGCEKFASQLRWKLWNELERLKAEGFNSMSEKIAFEKGRTK